MYFLPKMEIIRCETQKLSANFLTLLQQILNRYKSEPSIVIGLSGGSLVDEFQSIFDKLAFDWSETKFIFADERKLPFDNAESTFGLYKKELVSKSANKITDNQFITINPILNVHDCALDYEQKLKSCCTPLSKDGRWPKIHILLLGLGSDGHTCSLFPNHEALQETDKWVVAIENSPKPPPERVSLTLPVLNNAQNLIFVAKGASKAPIIKEIFSEQSNLPAALVKPIDGKFYWLLDEAAAALL